MAYTEELTWILDKPGTTIHNQDERFRENIAFVHSLGRKCDCVGWSILKREDPKAEDVLEKIAVFCKENNWTARGFYIRTYEDPTSEWYEIRGPYLKYNTIGQVEKITAEDGSTIRSRSIHAYREFVVSPKKEGRSLYVPERFRNAYNKLGLSDLAFCWAKDVGKYAAEQYFEVYGLRRIPHVAVAWHLKDRDLRDLGPGSGWLPRLGEVFQSWTQISLPYCYRKADMPAGGFAYAYVPRSDTCCGMLTILVHKDTAELLLREKALPAGALRPVPVVDEAPVEYTVVDTAVSPRPTAAYMEQSISDYQKLKDKPRPIFKISEKEALKLMRKAKTERKELFGKKLPKARAEALSETVYKPLLPYYLVADGGWLSDEYHFLPVDATRTETEAFYQQLEKEELLESKPDGTVIACCASGDRVLLLRDGSVIRFDHEAPEVMEQWQSMAQFVTEAVND